LVALLISSLAARVREQAEAAGRREHRTRVLYAMSRDLAGLTSPEEIGRIVASHIGELFHGPAALLVPQPDGTLAHATVGAPDLAQGQRDVAVARWVFDHRQPAGMDTQTLPAAGALFVPVESGERALGVVALAPHETLRPLAPDQTDLLDALARLAGAALERVRLIAEREDARLAVERERLRNTLLSSVSHDLRTPLAAITGASTSLLTDEPHDPAVRRELATTIQEEAERLNRLVGNLLEITRLESSNLEIRRDWCSIEELVGSALARVEGRGHASRTVTRLAADLPLVLVDAVLIEQLLVNLLDNALKHGGAGCAVELQARVAGEALHIEVLDDGPGFAPGSEERIFEKFVRGSSETRGFGLGLAICRAILTAHGGRIWAEQRHPRGAAFHFELPIGGTPPPPPTGDESGDAHGD
jgi:two-component system sensor histidine kinase KdpD